MNIEEAIKIVKKIRQDYNLYYPMDRKEVEAVETLLTAYEKEKEKNKRLRKCHLQYEEMTGIDLLLPEKEE